MNYIRCGMAQAKLTRIALRLRRESAINNNIAGFCLNVGFKEHYREIQEHPWALERRNQIQEHLRVLNEI